MGMLLFLYFPVRARIRLLSVPIFLLISAGYNICPTVRDEIGYFLCYGENCHQDGVSRDRPAALCLVHRKQNYLKTT